MSLQDALCFLQKVREDEDLRATIVAGRRQLKIDDLVAMGEALGLRLDAEEVRTAFRHDWALRAIRARRKADAG